MRRPGSDLAARLLAGGASVLAFSVLADSAIEHYRGSFHNPAMFAPLAVSGLSLGLNGGLAAGVRGQASIAAHLGAVATGLIGLGFHVYDIAARPARFRLGNLFYAAPVGAPAALVLAGAIGMAAERAGRGSGPGVGRGEGALIAAGLIGTVAEASLLHFRGAFHNRAMWLPIMVPPLAAVALARDVVRAIPHRATMGLLGVTAILGLAGSGFHVFGISRRMGGWRNWRQNLLAGPPVPAPPAFTGLALGGLGILLLMRRAARA